MVRPMVAHEETLDLAYLDELVGPGGAPGADAQSAVLPLLQAIQARHRYLPKGALERLSARTGVELGRVMDVATFYNQFRLTPVGEHHVCVCHGTACHVAGAGRISEALARHLEIPEGADTDARRRFTITPVACLGCCSLAPVMQIDGVTLGHLTAATACQALDSAAAGKLAAGAARPLVEKHVAHAAPAGPQRGSP
jgi:NADH-quinone oxidoreductase subunit F